MKTIEELWQSYVQSAYKLPLPPEQYNELKQAFFACALTLTSQMSNHKPIKIDPYFNEADRFFQKKGY